MTVQSNDQLMIFTARVVKTGKYMFSAPCVYVVICVLVVAFLNALLLQFTEGEGKQMYTYARANYHNAFIRFINNKELTR